MFKASAAVIFRQTSAVSLWGNSAQDGVAIEPSDRFWKGRKMACKSSGGAARYLSATALALSWVGGASGQSIQAGAPAASAAVQASGLQEIVVTAQKRSERLNSVPITVTAASGTTLAALGILDSKDLGKLVPGFTFTETALATPVYTLRGVGFYDSALGATPAVTVYVDQIPLTYPQMTRNATFDLERVEVLKGPQGTLFGQNSTGGAVNYIAAKPTDSFKAGFDATVGRFATANIDGFISGPITDTISARLAVAHDGEGNWQYSYTHPGETRGQVNITKARLLVDWNINSRLRTELGVSGWIDKSDTPGAQLVGKTPSLPQLPAFYDYPLAPQNGRAADWTPGFPAARDDKFYLLSLRADYALSDDVKLTSLTSYARLTTRDPVDADGTALNIDNSINHGAVRTFNQETRVEANISNTRVVVGGNFSRDHIDEDQSDSVGDGASSLNTSLPGLPVENLLALSRGSARTYAGFANIEQRFGDQFTLQGGVRYTDDKRSFNNCLADVGDRLAPSIQGLANYVLRPALGIAGQTTIAPGACVTLDSNLNAGPVLDTLDQNNISWRIGPSFKLTPNTLLYANISKGYKSGTAPTIFGVSASQYRPTTQESVLAYEGGFKSGLWGHRLQINGAGFYYDYDNKQILGTALDPIFGPLQTLVNVPKSTLYGAELEVTVAPLRGLSITASATYVHSQVNSNFLNYNAYGTPINFKGDEFPYTPDWQAVINAQYTVPLNSQYNMFVGGNLTYNDRTTGFFGSNIPYNPADPQHTNQQGQNPSGSVVADALDIKAYALLDLRAGIETADGTLRLTIWGRNITNTYYWTNATYYPSDSTVRFAGNPVTYGATLAYRFGGR